MPSRSPPSSPPFCLVLSSALFLPSMDVRNDWTSVPRTVRTPSRVLLEAWSSVLVLARGYTAGSPRPAPVPVPPSHCPPEYRSARTTPSLYDRVKHLHTHVFVVSQPLFQHRYSSMAWTIHISIMHSPSLYLYLPPVLSILGSRFLLFPTPTSRNYYAITYPASPRPTPPTTSLPPFFFSFFLLLFPLSSPLPPPSF